MQLRWTQLALLGMGGYAAYQGARMLQRQPVRGGLGLLLGYGAYRYVKTGDEGALTMAYLGFGAEWALGALLKK